MKDWSTGSPVPVPPLPAFGQQNPILLIHAALHECPDQVPAPQVGGLEFIKDPDQRHDLRADMTTVTNAVKNAEWKAATVIAGSLVEALLLWAIQEKAKRRGTLRLQPYGLRGNTSRRAMIQMSGDYRSTSRWHMDWGLSVRRLSRNANLLRVSGTSFILESLSASAAGVIGRRPSRQKQPSSTSRTLSHQSSRSRYVCGWIAGQHLADEALVAGFFNEAVALNNGTSPEGNPPALR